MYLVQIRKIIRKTKRSGYFVADSRTTKRHGITIVNTTGEKLLVDSQIAKKLAPRRKK